MGDQSASCSHGISMARFPLYDREQMITNGGDMVQILDIVCIVAMYALLLFTVIGSYILQRRKYWNRVWRSLGKPEVRSTRELKALMKREDESVASACHGARNNQ